jgi:hypothetical protein
MRGASGVTKVRTSAGMVKKFIYVRPRGSTGMKRKARNRLKWIFRIARLTVQSVARKTRYSARAAI